MTQILRISTDLSFFIEIRVNHFYLHYQRSEVIPKHKEGSR